MSGDFKFECQTQISNKLFMELRLYATFLRVTSLCYYDMATYNQFLVLVSVSELVRNLFDTCLGLVEYILGTLISLRFLMCSI